MTEKIPEGLTKPEMVAYVRSGYEVYRRLDCKPDIITNLLQTDYTFKENLERYLTLAMSFAKFVRPELGSFKLDYDHKSKSKLRLIVLEEGEKTGELKSTVNVLKDAA